MADIWDIAIAGAGPAGSTTAFLLAKQGYRVALLDRAHFPRPKACAEYLSPGVMQTLTRLGLGSAIASGDTGRVAGMEIVAPSGKQIRVQYQGDHDRYWARTIRREQLDFALVREAETAGASVFFGRSAKEPIVEDGMVRGFRGGTSAGALEIRARVSIIADGARSSLTRSLGLSRPASWPVRLGLVAHFGGEARLHDGFGQMHVERDGYCGIAPLPNGEVNVSIVTRANAVGRARMSATQYFDGWVRRSAALREALADCERIGPVRGVGPIGSRTRRAWCPGALVVGDAASFFDPFTGEGIYRALRGAELAAEIAGGSVCGRVMSFSHYDRLRAHAFGRKEMVTRLVQLFVQYPRLMEYSFPRLACRPLPARSLGLVLGDVRDASEFLRPGTLWSALRP